MHPISQSLTSMVEVLPAPAMPVSEVTRDVTMEGAASPPAQNMRAPPLAAATPI